MSEGVPGGRVRTDVSNVLVIGSGAAGLRAAIAAHEVGSEVVIVGKRDDGPARPRARPGRCPR